jgi:ketosteroid isomerase-like protein
MSSQNVELVRRWHALSPDLRDVDPNDPAIFDVAFVHGRLDEEFELRLPGDYPEGESIFRGREGFRRLLVMMRDVWAEWRVEPERFFDAGDKVVVFTRVVARGSASGVRIELPGAYVWSIKEARLTSARVYLDRSEALEAVGLKPD